VLSSPQAFIHVIDINQHRPQFLESHYEVTIPEDTPSGREILQVSATDKDKGKGLIYTIHGSVDPKSTRLFQLDPSSGVLTTAEGFSSQPMPQHTLTVMVSPSQIPLSPSASLGYMGHCRNSDWFQSWRENLSRTTRKKKAGCYP